MNKHLYAYDFACICLHTYNNSSRTTREILLAIFIFARSTHASTIYTPDSYILSMRKWLVESIEKRIKNRRRMITVALPLEKCIAYTKQIKKIIRRNIYSQNIELNIGKYKEQYMQYPMKYFS